MPETKRCKANGCAAKVSNADYCHLHKPDKETRLTANKRGYDAKWRRYREQYLKQHPFCVMCMAKGKAVSATVVDHIKPVVNGQQDKLFWLSSNHQALCHSCHSYKTIVIDKKGFGMVRG